MIESNVFKLSQPGTFSNPLTEVLRSGARSLLAHGTDEHARWLKRNLSARRYVYFWADRIHVQARPEHDAQCLLVVIGATPEGKKELVGLIDEVRESA